MGVKKEYLDGSEKVVLEALQIAFVENGSEPLTAGVLRRFVRDSGVTLSTDPPHTEVGLGSKYHHSSGGWSVFDFTDRTKGFLDRLVRKGLVEKDTRGETTVYYPS